MSRVATAINDIEFAIKPCYPKLMEVLGVEEVKIIERHFFL